MTPQEIDHIESAIRHIQTAVDVDQWAMEKPLTVCIHSDNADDIKRFDEEMRDFKYDH